MIIKIDFGLLETVIKHAWQGGYEEAREGYLGSHLEADVDPEVVFHILEILDPHSDGWEIVEGITDGD